MNFTLECEQEADGRWIAEFPILPGILAYGDWLQMQCHRLRYWLFVLLPAGLKMATPSL